MAKDVNYWVVRKGKNATQAANKICAVYGEDAVAERIVRKWFARFKAGNFDLEDQERPGRPSTTDEDMIRTEIENKLLPNNETIDSAKYCSRLDKLKTSIEHKRPEIANRKGVVFHQDNAQPHVSLSTRQKLLEFGWDVLPHPL
ncbi:uncharacterized protein LOC144477998, partial [Augochlora pura]